MDESQMMRHVKRIKKEEEDFKLLEMVYDLYMQGWNDAIKKAEEIIKKQHEQHIHL